MTPSIVKFAAETVADKSDHGIWIHYPKFYGGPRKPEEIC
jgi:hypothetical protein